MWHTSPKKATKEVRNSSKTVKEEKRHFFSIVSLFVCCTHLIINIMYILNIALHKRRLYKFVYIFEERKGSERI